MISAEQLRKEQEKFLDELRGGGGRIGSSGDRKSVNKSFAQTP